MKVISKCRTCDELFEHDSWVKKQFCSRRCSLTYRNKYDNPAKRPEVKEKMRKRMIRDIKLGKMKAYGHGMNPSRPNELNGMWQGGKKDPIQRIRGTKKYRDFREKVVQRDNYICTACGKRAIKKGNLHIDHLKDFINYPELRFELSNSRSLCASCHAKKTLWGEDI